MTFFLREIEGKNIGDEYSLLPGDNLVGRSRSSNIRVFNEDVSGKHFILSVSDDGVLLRNLSHYGTALDGVIVQDSAEIQTGQKIRAGKSLCFELLQRDENVPDQVSMTSEETSVTKFVSDMEKTSSANIESADENLTGGTKFAQGMTDTVQHESEVTGVTKFASDISRKNPFEETEKGDASPDIEDKTGVTKFASDVPPADPIPGAGDTCDNTSAVEDKTRAAETVFHSSPSPNEITSGPPETELNDTSVSGKRAEITETSESARWNKTSAEGIAIKSSETAGENNTDIERTASQATHLPDGTAVSSNDDLPPEKSGEGTFLEEQGMFFEEEANDESEKTNANETQVVQTRMASADEMNFIKTQIKKQQQSRLFFKFLVFAFLAVCLGVIWMMKSPQKEPVLSWPHGKKGSQIEYYTSNIAAWDGYKKGGFDLYCPVWPNNKTASSGDTITIDSFLGKKGDVPLSIILHREDSLGHVYENRSNALQGALKRLSETPDEMFNFEGNAVRTFLLPAIGQAGNAIPCDVVSYQRDKGRSWFGILRFFRCGRYNYILRTEVPASEKHRALPVLTGDSFLTFHPNFVRCHWEGDDEYVKGDPDRMLLGVRDELLNHNSPMQYPRLELTIKSILAQTRYHNQKKQYLEAMGLLILLREKQQQWYNGQRIRWASADKENNLAEKVRIRNESEAVFSINGDKRRYDILRDYWE